LRGQPKILNRRENLEKKKRGFKLIKESKIKKIKIKRMRTKLKKIKIKIINLKMKLKTN